MEKLVKKKEGIAPIDIRFTGHEARLLRDFTGLTSRADVKRVGIAENVADETNELVYKLYLLFHDHVGER